MNIQSMDMDLIPDEDKDGAAKVDWLPVMEHPDSTYGVLPTIWGHVGLQPPFKKFPAKFHRASFLPLFIFIN